MKKTKLTAVSLAFILLIVTNCWADHTAWKRCSKSTEGVRCGGEEELDISDALTILLCDVESIGYPFVHPYDVNGDGSINSFDALAVFEYLFGITSGVETPSNVSGDKSYWVDESGNRFMSDTLEMRKGSQKKITLIAEVPSEEILRAFKFTLTYNNTFGEIVAVDKNREIIISALKHDPANSKILVNGVDPEGIVNKVSLLNVTIKGVQPGTFNFDIVCNEFGYDVSKQFRPSSESLSVRIIEALKGDIDGNDKTDLNDAIISLQVLGGLNPLNIRTDYASSDADVNGDSRAGLEEAVYAMQKTAGIIPE